MLKKLSEILPDEISDEAAYHLVTFFTKLTTELESRYFAQMRRYIRDNSPPELPDILKESGI
jgi:hypothetical protein